jgi:hypothetical protein
VAIAAANPRSRVDIVDVMVTILQCEGDHRSGRRNSLPGKPGQVGLAEPSRDDPSGICGARHFDGAGPEGVR